ncbi:Mrp/NBP35 family ATP-binding protein [Pelagerythrobacter marinus]|uniref:Mrp/NBP35 family ATP-binding protein n=1 Tax=Pelagerythrobacter marinus TaxID=538382 RepID=UPI00203739BB|nr:Mrp/NBP35 family ATP-binding protein [Pelagerythrobacter marinus]USA39499.1 Mrp/NBP35 family ATP-binding protein [Pelagerythrobacter marinus]WPZ06361.1 Mrp/NBP35 family ATP-binding protein [Pelagerythrobacter marinus]
MTEEELKARLPAPIAARVQSLKLAGGRVTAILDAAGLDPAARESLEGATRDTLGQAEGVDEVRVATIASRPERRIVAIGSGKGGVGKSTLTANLAVALAREGHKVGVVDADIYGPSQPRLLDNEGERPVAENDKLVPVESRWGVPVLSIGHLVEPGRAIAWRGPMAGRALGQLIDANWGDTELLLVDLPPGTGDVQITMLQRFRPAGAVIVSTPQDLALIDATRAMQMFEVGQIPVLGLVENMAGYLCPHCGEASDPFGSGGAEAQALSREIPFLGRIPLAPAIREASDAGTPPAAGEGGQGEAFREIARRLAARLEEGAA